jgi:hypothetical protein
LLLKRFFYADNVYAVKYRFPLGLLVSALCFLARLETLFFVRFKMRESELIYSKSNFTPYSLPAVSDSLPPGARRSSPLALLSNINKSGKLFFAQRFRGRGEEEEAENRR